MTGHARREADVIVHVHPALPMWRDSLVLQLLPLWRDAGLRAEVLVGADPADAARVGLLHIDLTRVPPAYASLRTAYPALLNGIVDDISKRRVNPALSVSRHDAYDGPVIVKTDLNAGGVPERLARRRNQARLGRLFSSLLDYTLPRRPTGRWWNRDRTYPVFPRKSAVPGWMWRRPDLLVQRFVTERTSRGYALRVWFFLGDADFHFVRYSDNPLFPRGSGAGSDRLDEVPPELRAFRASWGFDFAKFEYVLRDGEPCLLDANKTPSFGLGVSPLHHAALPRLARGIERWL